MKKIALIFVIVIFLFNACALEIANVIGPGGGYVFYDKGNYDGGWRYIQCSSFDFGELKASELEDPATYRASVAKLLKSHSGGYQSFEWEIPDEAQMKKMLECFSYGLTHFSDEYYYLTINKKSDYDENDPYDLDQWGETVILHKNFNDEANGKVEKADIDKIPEVVKIRPIRRF
jgi:hypothetical protein